MNDKKRFIPIRGQLIGCCLILIFFGAIFAVGVYGLSHYQDQRKSQIMEDQNDFADFYSSLKNLDSALSRYFSSPDQEKPQVYVQCGNYLQEFEKITQRLSTNYEHFAVRDFCYMSDTYTDQVRSTLQEFLGGDSAKIYAEYQQTQRTKDLMENSYAYMWRVIGEESQQKKEELNQVCSRMWTGAVAAGVFVLAGCLIYVVWFSKHLLMPVASLTKTAQSISSGNGEPRRMDLGQMKKNELQILASSFYQLLDTTNRQFQILCEKSDLEQRLKDEELRRVTVQSQLHRARLQMFQSLVNPHFLFNTLSVVADLSFEEGAPRTQESIEQLSVFLRYSLTYLNKTVTISQEAKNLRIYFYIQRLRFKERFRFFVEIDPDCENVVLPAMILQPLAENSLQHGVGSYTSGGTVACRVSRDQRWISLIMEDNGVGMSREKIDKVKQHIQEGMDNDFSEGIGLLLVYQRLQDFFDNRACLEIESDPGIRTVIRIMIPEMEGNSDRSNTGR